MTQAEAQPSFGPKCDVLLAGQKCRGSSGRRTHSGANEASLSTPSQSSNQRSAATAAANPRPVSLLVGSPAGDDIRRAQWNLLLRNRYRVESQAKFTGMVQAA